MGRAGELTTDEINKIVAVISNPLQFKIPSWMLNKQRDTKDGKTSQKFANFLDQSLREDLERMKRCRLHRGLRHYWGIRVRGQHTIPPAATVPCWIRVPPRRNDRLL